MSMIAKSMARFLGIGLVLLGVAGFVGNPVVGSEGLLETDQIGNAIHLAFGVLLLLNSRKGEATAAMGLYLVAGLSFFFGAVGYKEVGNYGKAMMFGSVMVTPMYNYFHLALAVILGLSGLMNTSNRQLLRD